MTKELQDLAWLVLPKEFKEEVKETYKEYTEKIAAKSEPEYRIAGYIAAQTELELLFGIHNLASDAEGEEMLTVSRKEIQQLVAANDKLIKKHPGRDSIEAIQAKTVSTILNRLFGSKCLPDNSNEDKRAEPKEYKAGKEMLTCSKESVCKFYAHLLDTVENERMSEHYPEWCELESEYIALFGEKAFADYFRLDGKQAPAKPKFEVGDIVRIKSDAAAYHHGYQNGYAWLPERDIFVGKITTITNIRISGDIELKISGGNITWEAIDLEPYTEPKEGISPNVNYSDLNIDELVAKGYVPNPSIFFDGTFKDNIRNERRLNIAVQLTQAMFANPFSIKFFSYAELVRKAVEATDALIAECKKGGTE